MLISAVRWYVLWVMWALGPSWWQRHQDGPNYTCTFGISLYALCKWLHTGLNDPECIAQLSSQKARLQLTFTTPCLGSCPVPMWNDLYDPYSRSEIYLHTTVFLFTIHEIVHLSVRYWNTLHYITEGKIWHAITCASWCIAAVTWSNWKAWIWITRCSPAYGQA